MSGFEVRMTKLINMIEIIIKFFMSIFIYVAYLIVGNLFLALIFLLYLVFTLMLVIGITKVGHYKYINFQ